MVIAAIVCSFVSLVDRNVMMVGGAWRWLLFVVGWMAVR